MSTNQNRTLHRFLDSYWLAHTLYQGDKGEISKWNAVKDPELRLEEQEENIVILPTIEMYFTENFAGSVYLTKLLILYFT